MTENVQQVAEQKPVSQASDADRNFANLRKSLEERTKENQALQERISKLEASQKQKEVSLPSDDDDYDQPFVDNAKLKKEMRSVYEQAKQDAKKETMNEFQRMMQEQRQQDWIRGNPDFYDVMQHAQKFADTDPELAETILAMPEGFERQKLVYRNIKSLGLHKPEGKKSDIQDKIDANRKPLYYQPSGSSTSPYSSGGDFSVQGQKASYEKMLQLKNNLRLG
jgi:hypothetical protein